MADDVVLYEVDDGVAVVTFNRPEKLNAFTVEFQDRYFDLLAQADADRDVRVIVVTGAGRGFCSGADLELLKSIGEPDAGGLLAPGKRLPSYPLSLRKPFIAAVNGAAIGAGLAYAVQADLRFVSETAKLGTAFAQRGLVAEYGLSWMLPRICGWSQAMDLLLSARMISGDEVLRFGLADRLLPADEVLPAAIAYARELIATCSPASMSIIKTMVREHWAMPFADAELDTVRRMRESFTGPDVKEGVASFLEQRAAVFPPLDEGTRFT